MMTGLQFEPKVTIGNVVTILTIIVGGVIFGVEIRNQTTANATNISALYRALEAETAARQESIRMMANDIRSNELEITRAQERHISILSALARIEAWIAREEDRERPRP